MKPEPFLNGVPTRKDGLPEMPVIQTLTFQVTVFVLHQSAHNANEDAHNVFGGIRVEHQGVVIRR